MAYKRKIDPEAEEEIARRFQAGETVADLRQAFHATPKRIKEVLAARGIRWVSGRKRIFSDEDLREIARRYAAGESANDLAAAFATKPAKIRAVVMAQGGEFRGHRVGKLTDAQQQDLIAAYVSGEPLAHLARRFSISAGAIGLIVKRRGVVPRLLGGQRRVFTDEQVQEMRHMLAAGATQQMLADHFKCSQTVISRALRKHGYTRPSPGGPNHNRWSGGRHVNENGYVEVWLAPDDLLAVMRNRVGYVKEHRLVLARSLGRPLLPSEHIHHINGDRQDNRLENLQLRQGHHGAGVHYVCLDCGSHNVKPVGLAERRAPYRA